VQRDQLAGIHVRRIAEWAIAGTISLLEITATAATPPLVITAPVEGATVMAGTAIAITVNVTSGSYPKGMAIMAHDPLGATDLQPVSGSTVQFSLTIPANTPPDSYAITAVGMNAKGELVSSAPIDVRVESADIPTSLAVYPPAIALAGVGDTTEPIVVGKLPGGTYLDVTHSSRLVIRSEDPAIAVARDGIITAVGSGHTSMSIQYGSVSTTTAVTVATAAVIPKK
jgi:hypothetical protein